MNTHNADHKIIESLIFTKYGQDDNYDKIRLNIINIRQTMLERHNCFCKMSIRKQFNYCETIGVIAIHTKIQYMIENKPFTLPKNDAHKYSIDRNYETPKYFELPPRSQFDKLRFESKKLFDKWLEKITFKKIYLKDSGQDMQVIWVHKSGEILHCDFHSDIYRGLFVDMKELATGEYLRIYDNTENRFNIYQGLIVRDVSRRSELLKCYHYNHEWKSDGQCGNLKYCNDCKCYV